MLITNHHPYHSIWYYIFEGTYWLLQIVSAKIQAIRIAKNLPISHFWWSVGMIVIALIMIIVYKRIIKCTWWKALRLGLSLLLGRFIIFSPALNKFRKLPFFYVGKQSIQDKLLTHWFPIAWIIALVILIVNNFY